MCLNILRNGLPSDLAAVKSFVKKADVLIKRQPDGAIRYKNIVAAFDIETSRLEDVEQSIMYIWQLDIDNQFVIYGRMWDDYRYFLSEIESVLEMSEHLILYVHNLAYEFQFLTGVFNFKKDNVFAVDSRRPLYARWDNHIEYRCCYIHSNMSLEKFCQSVGAPITKGVGLLDYDKVRFPWTLLTESELEYCIRDVSALVAAIKIEMEKDGDTLATIPLTSTGYVRREFKAALKPYRKMIQKMFPDAELYKQLRYAFRGGNTHANRWIVGEIWYNVHSYDKASSYPSQQLNKKYPMGFFKKRNINTIEKLKDLCDTHSYCWLAEVVLTNISLKAETWGCPYIPLSKVRDLIQGENYVLDNGRIISADCLMLTITDVDYSILVEEYNFEIEIKQCWTAFSDYLPDEFRDLVRKLFVTKTELKGVDDYYYMKSKNKFNSLYGMTAQDPGKLGYIFDGIEWRVDDKEVGEILDDARKSMFLLYQWGVWCTAHARRDLEDGIRLVHDSGDLFIYTDTDCVKYVGNKTDWTKLNTIIEDSSRKNGGVAKDVKGAEHVLGVFEKEETALQFITMGAKKYAYITSEGKLKITIAGVPKIKGAQELEAAGGLEAFKPGFIFRGGKLESVYNDLTSPMPYHTADGHDIMITRNLYLRPTTYELGYGTDYIKLLDSLDAKTKWLYKINGKP